MTEVAYRGLTCTKCWKGQRLPAKVTEEGDEEVPRVACLKCGNRDWIDLPHLAVPSPLRVLDCGHSQLEHHQSKIDQVALREVVVGKRGVETLNDRQRTRLRAILKRDDTTVEETWWSCLNPES